MTAAINFSKRISEFPVLTQLTGNEDIPYSLNGQNGRFKSGSLGGSLPGIYGPLQIYSYTTNSYLITADDLNSPATVTTNQGTINQTGNTFTLNPGNYSGPLILTMGSQTFTITVNSSIVNTPSIITPVSGTQNLGSSVTLTASAFTMTGFQDIHKATNWQIATDSAFTNIVQQSLMDQVNLTSWTVSNLTAATSYYVRVQYISGTGITSSYSTTSTLSTQSIFAPSQITSQLSPNIAGSYFGYKVSLSGDGTIAVVAAPFQNNQVGEVYIYTLVSGTWSLFQTLTGTGYQFGQGVCISLDGSTIAIGAPGNSSIAGAVYIYRLVSGLWTLLTSYTSTGPFGNAYGGSVSLNSNGSLLVVGAIYDTGSIGAAYIYSVSTTLTQIIRLTDNQSSTTFGYNVRLSSDGSTLAVSAPNYNATTGNGFVYLYTAASNWALQSTLTGLISLGMSLSFNANGTILAVGAPYANSFVGVAYVYTLANGVWSLSQTAGPIGAGGYQGISVSLNQAGTLLAIGAATQSSTTANYAGAANIYSVSSTSLQLLSTVYNNVASSDFGWSLSLNSSGSLLLVGAYGQNSNTGAIYFVQ